MQLNFMLCLLSLVFQRGVFVRETYYHEMSEDCFCLHMARTHESDQYGKKQHSIHRFASWPAAIRNLERLERGTVLLVYAILAKDPN